MASVQLAGNGFGGVVQGNFGNYQAASDGTFTVDTRDASAMLAMGMTYVAKSMVSYTLPLAPLVATISKVVASGALSNGTLSIANQPDVMRPITVEVGTGTGPISAGTATLVYTGNDGVAHTDVFNLACPASSAVTQTTSYGVLTLTSATVAGVTGGTSPWIRSSTTSALSLPLGAGGVDVAVLREYDAGATVAVGTAGVSTGSIIPTTAANGTVTYTFIYDQVFGTS